VIDFTDSTNPVEIAYFDRGPIHEKKLVLGGYWSTYWYDGKIYGTEIARGLGPAVPVVAKAYIDQMQRRNDMPSETAAELRAALDRADAQLKTGEGDAELSNLLAGMASSVEHDKLSKTVSEIAARLR